MSERILIVDDTASVREFSQIHLKGQGYQVETAENGAEALTKIDEFKPELILMDLMMPEMNGIECCKEIKQNETTRDIKVVMVTSLSEYPKISEAFAAGCDDYVVKPVDRTELMLKVKELLKFSNLRKLLKEKPCVAS